MPRVSFIVGCYERPGRLRTCLASLIDQTFQDFEIIVTDNSVDPVAIEKIKELCDIFRNVHFLSDSTFHIPEYNLHVLGTTLWTQGEDDTTDQYQYNDFQRIHNMSLCGYMNKLHEKSVAFLKHELEKHKNDNSTVLVLTHHLPSFQLIAPQYKNSDINHLFATNLNSLFRDYRIHHWICGHSHTPMKKTIENTKVWMNPIGYPGENRYVSWTETFEI